MRMVLEIDEALLGQARRLLGTPSRRRTVNRALADLVAERRRLAAVEAELRRLAGGYYESVVETDER